MKSYITSAGIILIVSFVLGATGLAKYDHVMNVWIFICIFVFTWIQTDILRKHMRQPK